MCRLCERVKQIAHCRKHCHKKYPDNEDVPLHRQQFYHETFTRKNENTSHPREYSFHPANPTFSTSKHKDAGSEKTCLRPYLLSNVSNQIIRPKTRRWLPDSTDLHFPGSYLKIDPRARRLWS